MGVNPISGDVFNKEQVQSSEDLNKNTDGNPVSLEKKIDDRPEDSPKIEVESSTLDSEEEEMRSRPRLDKVLFKRVEKT